MENYQVEILDNSLKSPIEKKNETKKKKKKKKKALLSLWVFVYLFGLNISGPHLNFIVSDDCTLKYTIKNVFAF